MTASPGWRPPLEMWGGIECTVNRVGDRWFDQMVWSGHDRRPQDLTRLAELGIRALRYPVLWERVAPRSLDDPDWAWSDDRLSRLRALDVRPIVGLMHHGSGPHYTSLLDPDFPTRLAAFAGAVARRYPWVTDFTPVNEPLTTARFSGLYGHWYPHGRSDRDFIRALVHQMRGVVLAMRAIREVTPRARLIQTEDCGQTFGTRAVRHQVAHDEQRRWLTWDLLAGRVDDRHPLHPFLTRGGLTREDEEFFLTAACPPDILGLNYYVTSDRYLDHRCERYPPAARGGNGVERYADVEAVRGRHAGIMGHAAHLLAAWHRYRRPVAITEVHLGSTRDEQMRWLAESWHGAHEARAGGADVRAVTAWGLFGSYNWESLVTRDEGQYEPGAFDVRAPVPRRTALATTIQELANGDQAHHPILAEPGWWHRPGRLLRPLTRGRSVPMPDRRGVLIVGSGAGLPGGFARICHTRGLVCHHGSMQVPTASGSATIEALLERHDPWAVIDAGSAMTVDEAERDPDACYRQHVADPVEMAAACKRRGTRFVTFSSDQIFDGRKPTPYLEDDQPGPVNVYGVCKVEAERLVLDVLPDALIVRTGGLFGPWDDDPFLGALFSALDRGDGVRVPMDTSMSPTHTPDLIHAVLDLLIDEERGVWHLANDGAATWFELARRATLGTGRNAAAVAPIETTRVWGPAVRPRCTALASRRAGLLRPFDAALAAFGQACPSSGAQAPERHPCASP